MTMKRKNIEKTTEPTLKKPKINPKNTDASEKTPKEKKINAQSKGAKFNVQSGEKPEDWNKFKQEKKELRIKRRQADKTDFDDITRAKKIGEKLRCKTLKGGPTERVSLINELHSLLKSKNHYPRFVLSHDTSRIVQWLLKYSSDIVKEQISKELIPCCLEMMRSKYGIYCTRRLLKYGSTATKQAIVEQFYGNAIKLSTRALSAPVFELAYANFATPLQKQHLCQEFYGEIYRNSKDDHVKTLSDVYKDSENLKAATLGAVKANLLKVINKNLLDSSLVHAVLLQFLAECGAEDRAELITSLASHIVVLSNTKEGATVARICLWHGTSKDKKTAMKAIKEHLIEMAKHEHAHLVLIALLDGIDDTVLLNKMILGTVLQEAQDLAQDEWGRKVLLWLVAPGDSAFFHRKFVEELEEGRRQSNSKKDEEVRRKEIREHCIETLLGLVSEDPHFWLENASKAYAMLAVVKAGSGEPLRKSLKAIVDVIIDPNWEVTNEETQLKGIEHAGFHMVLKKLLMNDKNVSEEDDKFGPILSDSLNEDTLDLWLTLNRGCFLLVFIFENNSVQVQEKLKEKLSNMKIEKKNVGGKLLLKKLQS